ncbi:MFS general substrate transporter [Cylindrobasidium torrendii FP15055 ss-10]|uniref:MFS general substrate transporter n=1 Tax=Cylindrobasidium torrendii FP15055 ss-10 TaxID=1314674 RepID=A0A0D7BG30_9AGAR|nr:MFS general substrate transporter [Cylindrobasidium torrendii FP15055 ss-10]
MDTEQATGHTRQEAYSIYTPREKWFIVFLIAFGGLFSPFTANIYLPAIPTLTQAFHKSTELINITVTVYMVFQGVSPMLFGTLADQIGRRPIFAACLFILCASCVGLALVPTNAYWLLVVLRCVQAAGSASTIALGAGVIGDIATPAERGGFFGLYSVGTNLGPAVGPILGGVLSDHLGWRAIFWFLCIASFTCFLVLITFLPETLRSMVGNGSIPPPSKIYRPLLPVLGRLSEKPNTSLAAKKSFKNPILLFKEWDVDVLLVINGLYNALYYSVIATMSTLFKEYYPGLSETQIGLCYLPTSAGMMLGSVVVGRILNVQYQRILRQLALSKGADSDTFDVRTEHGIADDYPIEKARIGVMPYISLVFAAALAGYGWCIQYSVNLSGPLILQTVVGCAAMANMTASQTLMVDWVPNQSSSVTACNNLIRCTMGAVCVVLMDVILRSIKPGWTYVLLTGVCLLTIPLMYLVMKIGPARRKMRKDKVLLEDERVKS